MRLVQVADATTEFACELDAEAELWLADVEWPWLLEVSVIELDSP